MDIYDLTRKNADKAEFIKALNSVDWSKHGYEVDVRVMDLETAGNDIFVDVIDTKLYETQRVIYRAGTGKFEPSGITAGDFSSVLDAAGIVDL